VNDLLKLSAEVEAALASAAPVVALESTLISHGLPAPDNVQCALAAEATVRAHGAVPATIGIISGQLTVGLSLSEIETLADPRTRARKVSRRDLAATIALGETGATTVSATMICAALAGIEVFATGGIGGVHRDVAASFDISADLGELARTPVTVVCAGAKIILDLPKTVELLETLGVPVIGFECEEFPGFFAVSSKLALDINVTDAQAAAGIVQTQRALGLRTGILLVNEAPAANAIAAEIADGWVQQALVDAQQQNIGGKAVTPFLLERVNAYSSGASLSANIALILNNARLGAQLACALSPSS
jgi:pseudouridylate synthase